MKRIPFRDDGGTPAWRAAHAIGWPALRFWYRRANPVEVLLATVTAAILLLVVAPLGVLLICWAVIP
ncbi:MAG: hypothetical protein ACRYG8_24240 [Janthinobacterium lividum]